MPTAPRIVAFAGSARRESLNRKLLAEVAAAVRAAGGETTLVDLNDYVLPLYHGDLEDASGLPDNAVRLIALLRGHDALLIASPAYKSQLTPLLKNTIDWCTRADDDPFVGKAAAVVSASPGAFGGIRSMTAARALLTHLGCHVIPAQCILPNAHKAFGPDGKLLEDRPRQAAAAVAAELVRAAAALRV